MFKGLIILAAVAGVVALLIKERPAIEREIKILRM